MSRKNQEIYKEAKQALALDFKSHIPLKTQLEEKLRQWLANKPVGFRIPSERELAMLLNVSIIIVKLAIMKLNSEGFFIRNVKGTFLAKSNNSQQPAEHPLQKIAAGYLPTLSNKPTIKVAIFELWEKQQEMWLQSAISFNESDYSVNARIEFVPHTVADVMQYISYLKTEKIDVALVAYNMVEALKAQQVIMKLPDDIPQKLYSEEEYLISLNKKEASFHTSTISFVAPLSFSAWGILWNEKLVRKKLTLNDDRKITINELLDKILENAKSLKQKTLFSDALCFFWSFGVPPREKSEEDIPRNHIEKLFNVAEQLSPFAEKILWGTPYNRKGQEMFLAGEAAFYVGNLYAILQKMSETKFKWGGAVIGSMDNTYLNSGWNGLALVNVDNPKRGAADFIRFMISPTGQELFANFHMNIPFYRPLIHKIGDLLKHSGSKQIEASFKDYKFLGRDVRNNWYDLLTSNLGLFLREVVEKRMSAKEGVQEFFNTLENNLSLKIVNS